MKRKLFFLLEKLEIKRDERIAISTLLIVLVTLSGILAFNEPDANYSEEEYEELEKVFKEKNEKIEQEEELILARYEPTYEAPVSMTVRINEKQKSNLPDTTEQPDDPLKTAEMINVNTATNHQLQELPGIGPAYAGRIVNWREENGEFTSKDQLLEIKGIGEKRLARIKPLITL